MTIIFALSVSLLVILTSLIMISRHTSILIILTIAIFLLQVAITRTYTRTYDTLIKVAYDNNVTLEPFYKYL